MSCWRLAVAATNAAPWPLPSWASVILNYHTQTHRGTQTPRQTDRQRDRDSVWFTDSNSRCVSVCVLSCLCLSVRLSVSVSIAVCNTCTKLAGVCGPWYINTFIFQAVTDTVALSWCTVSSLATDTQTDGHTDTQTDWLTD